MTVADPDPDSVVRTVRALSDEDLHNLAEVVRQVQIERAGIRTLSVRIPAFF